MALSNKTDPQAVQARLADWLRLKLPDARDLQVSDARIPSGNGFSNETVLLTARWQRQGADHCERLVARIQPPGPAVHPTYDLKAEYELLKVLGTTTPVPVPAVLWWEGESSILGSPFMVMRQVAGRAPSDNPPYTQSGWVLELSALERARLCRNAVKALADVHAVNWETLSGSAVESHDFGPPGLAQQLGYIEHAYEWSANGLRSPLIEAGLLWLRSNRPMGQERLALSWGDARIGNMLFAEDLSVAAVLDWELACLASPEMDLGWWLYLQRRFTDSMGFPLPEGLFTREQLVEQYQEISGHEIKHLDYYEIFATVRGAIQMLRVAHLMIGAGLVPEDSPIRLSNPPLHMLADLLHLEPPQQPAQTWIGKTANSSTPQP